MSETFEILDEDDDQIGEVRRVHDSVHGWLWSAWAINSNVDDGHHARKLNRHHTAADAIAEINRYWGVLK